MAPVKPVIPIGPVEPVAPFIPPLCQNDDVPLVDKNLPELSVCDGNVRVSGIVNVISPAVNDLNVGDPDVASGDAYTLFADCELNGNR